MSLFKDRIVQVNTILFPLNYDGIKSYYLIYAKWEDVSWSEIRGWFLRGKKKTWKDFVFCNGVYIWLMASWERERDEMEGERERERL